MARFSSIIAFFCRTTRLWESSGSCNKAAFRLCLRYIIYMYMCVQMYMEIFMDVYIYIYIYIYMYYDRLWE